MSQQEIQRLTALVRAQQITIDKLEAQAAPVPEPVAVVSGYDGGHVEAMREALEALENPWGAGPEGVANAITALRTAIEQAEKQEPVAYRFKERPDDLRSAWRYVSKKQHVPHGWPYQSLNITGETK